MRVLNFLPLLILFFFIPNLCPASTLTPVIQMGGDLRFERDESQAIKEKTLKSYGVGLLGDHWFGMLEYASFNESTGNTSLKFNRTYESAFLWMCWEPTDYEGIVPFVGAGLGGIRQKVQTILLNEEQTDSGAWDPTLGASMGIRLLPKSWFWLSAEGRVYKNPYLDPDPQMGALLRVGFIFK